MTHNFFYFAKSFFKKSLLLCSGWICISGNAKATADPADYQVVMIAKQNDPWFEDMETGIEQLKKDIGLNVSIQYPETNDAAGQISIMENLIEQGIDAICIVPNDPEALLNTIEHARKAGIVVVTHEAPSISNYVDLDIEAFVNEDFGELFGKNIAKSIGCLLYTSDIPLLESVEHAFTFYHSPAKVKEKAETLVTNLSEALFCALSFT